SGILDIEQVSLILGDSWVLTLQERPGDAFDFVRDRIRNAKGRIRKKGADYLAYALMDAVVDNYFLVLENLEIRIEDIEEDLVRNLTPEMSSEIHRMKRQTINLRHSIWPLREVISGFQRTGSKLISESTAVFLRDLYDHTIQVIDTVETYRDILSGMLDTYLSLTSNRMNEVMKVLTIIATIFIPLTFIAGVYGMNFQYMPELAWKWAYPAVLGLMALVSLAMLIFFKRKKWI
ncbi:MAG: magnesium/cobalt transporter CorA, partial [bacterium]